jgi:hypothetical protein
LNRSLVLHVNSIQRLLWLSKRTQSPLLSPRHPHAARENYLKKNSGYWSHLVAAVVGSLLFFLAQTASIVAQEPPANFKSPYRRPAMGPNAIAAMNLIEREGAQPSCAPEISITRTILPRGSHPINSVGAEDKGAMDLSLQGTLTTYENIA